MNHLNPSVEQSEVGTTRIHSFRNAIALVWFSSASIYTVQLKLSCQMCCSGSTAGCYLHPLQNNAHTCCPAPTHFLFCAKSHQAMQVVWAEYNRYVSLLKGDARNPPKKNMVLCFFFTILKTCKSVRRIFKKQEKINKSGRGIIEEFAPVAANVSIYWKEVRSERTLKRKENWPENYIHYVITCCVLQTLLPFFFCCGGERDGWRQALSS